MSQELPWKPCTKTNKCTPLWFLDIRRTLHIILLLVKSIRIQHEQLLLSEVSTALDYLHEPRVVVLHVALFEYYRVDVLGAEHLLVFYLYGALFHFILL